MQMLITDGFNDYELLDSGEGERLERFGKFILRRPDPQAIWKLDLPDKEWDETDAVFGDKWKNKSVPEKWLMNWQGIQFYGKLTPFKHTGVFGEQVVNWEWLSKTAKGSVLNLFGYTGIATLVCAKAGVKVTHVDASKQAIGWARENQQASGLEGSSIRWILDDCLEFVKREGRRGVKYDGIILDPPVFGHGPNGKQWQFSRDLPELLKECKKILADSPIFILINAYAVSISALTLQNLLDDLSLKNGKTECGELVLKQKSSNRLLSTGIFGRWERN